jgi:hypothetical protein
VTPEEARQAARDDARRAISLARETKGSVEEAKPKELTEDLLGGPDPGGPGSTARRLVSDWREGLHIAAGISDGSRRAHEAGGEVWKAYGAALDEALEEANVTLVPTWRSAEDDRIVRSLYVIDRNRFPEAVSGVRTRTEEGIEYTWEGDVQRAFGAPRRGLLARLRGRRFRWRGRAP